MNVLVTGAGGMLGADFGEVLRVGRHQAVLAGRDEIDVTDLAAVDRWVAEHSPDLVIHAAAHTDADEGERNPDLPFRVNTIGTWNVALACRRHRAQMVYVSSCGVFDGAKAAPYTELDLPNPLTQHHRSKLKGEEIVASLVEEHFILRPGWLFGGRADHRRNFVEQRRREALRNNVVRSASDRFGSPTYTLDFAAGAMALVEAQAFGTYHLTNSGYCSRYEFVRRCVAEFGLATKVVPVTSDHFPRSAPMPAWEALDSYFYRLRGFAPLRSWENALSEYTRQRLLPSLV